MKTFWELKFRNLAGRQTGSMISENRVSIVSTILRASQSDIESEETIESRYLSTDDKGDQARKFLKPFQELEIPNCAN